MHPWAMATPEVGYHWLAGFLSWQAREYDEGFEAMGKVVSDFSPFCGRPAGQFLPNEGYAMMALIALAGSTPVSL
jgi:hypothetical protein